MDNKIKGIIFDVGGVVQFFKNGEHHRYMWEGLRMDKNSWFKAINPFFVDSITGKFTKEEVIKNMAINLKISEDELRVLWSKAYEETLSLNVDLVNLIRTLKQKYKTAILSDQWPISRELMVDDELSKNFDVLVFSNEVKMRKPEKKIYELILKKLNLFPEECVFIDDDEVNLKPAKELGMNTILFENNEKLVEDLTELGLKIR